ncbi:hypothetical protein Pyrfu_1102 [Pyrolobus fumarii 1A]|uniref:Uncharacterized protein n=1 Tax=Pyrolobus fumarii (strain DSM 11204 / 1A) TaxID=694429 RepID=G0EF72_PYRF1|nr:hypothetical protein [Pyrolobus fumarii]AEM38969.1 hypothetical protein Pyrfu_1102 [Pyrolobus fumarii 1A]
MARDIVARSVLLASLALSLALLAFCVSTAYAAFYPCKACHQAMNLTGNKKVVEFHKIDLTVGAHRGLYCSNCHVPPLMQELVGGGEVYIPGMHPRDKLMETNKVCAVCHPREYKDYEMLVHGNKTFECPDGKVVKIVGYKGVIYDFHVCSEYKNLEKKPARACVECHDPHDPTYYAINILPEPSDRPAPPAQDEVVYGTVAALVGGLLLIVGAFVLPSRPHG